MELSTRVTEERTCQPTKRGVHKKNGETLGEGVEEVRTVKSYESIKNE